MYTCFIDYSKAFDTVKHESLIETLKGFDIETRDIALLTNIYWNQRAAVRHEDEISDWMEIQQGVRQGCVASPHLFALYTEMIMRTLDTMDGFKIGGQILNNIRYADDTVLIAESEEQLQQLMNTVVQESERKGLYLNSSKSFTMIFTKSKIIPPCNITVHNKPLKQVESFMYLGSLLTSDARCEQEIKRRIGIAKSAYRSMENILSSRSIALPVRLRALKCYVWSTLLYGSETWTISAVMEKRLEAAENWFLRRMMRVSWTDKMTTKEVYKRANTRPSLLTTIIGRQLSFLGHIIRKDEVENLVITGFVEGSRSRGRQRETFLTYLKRKTNKAPTELIRLAREREEWRKLCRWQPTS